MHRCTLTRGGRTETIAAPILIDASGAGQAHQTHRPSDLLGFKAHFRNARLAADLMPVLVFPGGYGGLVTTNDGRVTIGCCIRRDALAAAHVHTSGPAAEGRARPRDPPLPRRRAGAARGHPRWTLARRRPHPPGSTRALS